VYISRHEEVKKQNTSLHLHAHIPTTANEILERGLRLIIKKFRQIGVVEINFSGGGGVHPLFSLSLSRRGWRFY
jgi:hypothetical protein